MTYTKGIAHFAVYCALAALTACTADPEAPTASEADAYRSSIQVLTTAVSHSKLSSEVDISGIVSAFRKATLGVEIGARVESRLIEPGQRVAAGETLLKLDTEMLRQQHSEAKALLSAREVQLQSAISELKRGRELIKKKFISQDNLEDLEFAEQAALAQRDAAKASVGQMRKRLNDSELSAPFSGTIEAVMVQQGDLLSPGQGVAVLADFSKLRISAGISARQTSLFRVGQTVGVSFSALGIPELQAEIASIGRIASPGTGNYPMEIWLDGQQYSQIREGMVATIRATMSSELNVLQIPSRAVLRRKGQTIVFIAEQGRAVIRHVATGRSTVDNTEIVSGLQQGDNVIVDGQFALRDGALIDVIR